jgi:hypothetical protein
VGKDREKRPELWVIDSESKTLKLKNKTLDITTSNYNVF